MVQDLTGGYCPMCDTVWAAPGRCKCEHETEIVKRNQEMEKQHERAKKEQPK